MQPVFRFAPSPNGSLHLGHALSALINFKAANKMGGRFLLRMEDIDLLRCTEEKKQAILDDLTWLGLTWEEPMLYQSNRFGAYKRALETLKQQGLLYPSTASRKDIQIAVKDWQAQTGEIWPRDPDDAPHFPRALLKAHEVESHDAAWRLDMSAALAQLASPLSWQETGPQNTDRQSAILANPEHWGDVVLARKDYPTSYHLAVTLDDAYQGITHVVRGQDLFYSTSVHRILQALLGLPQPIYHHHRLLTGPDGQKLAKSKQDIGLSHLRAQGITSEQVQQSLKITEQDLSTFC